MISLINALETKSTIDVKYVNYLYLVIVLAFLRFVVVPMVEWRTELTSSLEATSMQIRTLDSIESATQLYNERNVALDDVLESYDKLLFKSASVQTLQLDIQAKLSKLIDELNLEQKRVNWRNIPLNSDIKAAQLSLTLDGRAKALQALISEIESIEPKVVISSLFARSPSRTDKISTTLTLTVYFKETK